jgi:hypothetical protein
VAGRPCARRGRAIPAPVIAKPCPSREAVGAPNVGGGHPPRSLPWDRRLRRHSSPGPALHLPFPPLHLNGGITQDAIPLPYICSAGGAPPCPAAASTGLLSRCTPAPLPCLCLCLISGETAGLPLALASNCELAPCLEQGRARDGWAAALAYRELFPRLVQGRLEGMAGPPPLHLPAATRRGGDFLCPLRTEGLQCGRKRRCGGFCKIKYG